MTALWYFSMLFFPQGAQLSRVLGIKNASKNAQISALRVQFFIMQYVY